MNKTQEIESIENEITSLSGSVEHIKFQIQKLEKDITIFRTLEINCQENITVLRSNETIAIASEYKRARDEEKIISNRLKSLRIEFENFTNAFNRTSKLLLDAKSKRDILMKENVAIIIKGKFGKDGQE